MAWICVGRQSLVKVACLLVSASPGLGQGQDWRDEGIYDPGGSLTWTYFVGHKGETSSDKSVST